MELPVELQCHVWQLQYNGKIQDVHKELKQKVVLTDEGPWWFELSCMDGQWKRFPVGKEGGDYWKLRWGKSWTGWTERREALYYVAQPRDYYIKSLGKFLYYKNMWHTDRDRVEQYEAREVWWY